MSTLRDTDYFFDLSIKIAFVRAINEEIIQLLQNKKLDQIDKLLKSLGDFLS